MSIVNGCLATIDKTKITNTSFINLSSEQVGICLDIVYSSNKSEGWTSSQLLLLEEDNLTKQEWEEFISIAKELSNKLSVKISINNELKL